MRDVEFTCTAVLPLPPRAIAEQILDVQAWTTFTGYGPIPGVESAEFEVRTPEITASRIRVTNGDGTRHVEEIMEWEPESRLRLRMQELPSPLAAMATSIDETWTFRQAGGETVVTRSFALHPRRWWAGMPLRMIAFFLKRAIDRQLRLMQKQAAA